MTTALWALTGAVLFLGIIIAIGLWLWNGTSRLDRLTDEEIHRNLAPWRGADEYDFHWPSKDDEPEEESEPVA